MKNSPKWTNGVVAFTGFWEPLSFIRRGGSAVNVEEWFKYMHSEALAKKLSGMGYTAVVWHCYKGLGFKHEKEEMEMTQEFGKHCKKYGMKLGTYVNLGSFYADTFLKENPEAIKWLSKNVDGYPHSYSEFYRTYWRFRPCMTNKGFVEYVKKMALYAIEHVGSNWLLFDNNAQMPCYCDNCKRMFPEFIKKKYRYNEPGGKERVVSRLGYSDIDEIQIPRGTMRMPIDTLPAAWEAGLQEWIDYRCELLSKAFNEISSAIKSKYPEVAISLNPPWDYGEFVPLVWGNDVEGLADGADFMFSEDSNMPHVTTDKRLIGHIRTYKQAEALNVKAIVHHHAEPDKPLKHVRALIESAVFNRGFLGHVAWATAIYPDDHPIVKTMKFCKRYERYFAPTTTVSEVAVLRSRYSFVNNWAEAYQSKLAVEQVLIQYGVQFDNIMELKDKELGRYKLIILPNTITISDKTVAKLCSYVEKGGYLLVFENAGMCNEIGFRINKNYEGLYGERDESLGSFKTNQIRENPAFKIFKVSPEAQKRVYYVPKIEYLKKFTWNPSQNWVSVIDNSFWHLPGNHKEIYSIVKRILVTPMVVLPKMPSNIIPCARRFPDGDIMIAFINYDDRKLKDPFEVKISRFLKPDIKSAITLELFGEGKAIKFKLSKEYFMFTVQPFDIFSALILRRK